MISVKWDNRTDVGIILEIPTGITPFSTSEYDGGPSILFLGGPLIYD